MRPFNQKGNVLLFAIVAMTAISVLGTGIYFMTTTSTFSGLEANAQNRAYQLAVAGRDYALAKNLPNTTVQYPTGRTFTFANGDKYVLKIGVNNPDEIISTGIVGEGTPYEARRTIQITKTGFGSQADISFAKDIGSFSPTATAQAGFASVDQTAAQISLGQLQYSKFGSVWYGGNVAAGNCQNGKCDFGTGLRAYFIFKLARGGSDIPHGFTFAVFNGTDNSSTSAGGDIGMPELLAYAGNSCKIRDIDSNNCIGGYLDPNPDVSKKGIQAPKMAVEFDGRQNCCDTSTCVLGSCKTDFCQYDYSYPDNINSNSRADGLRSHMSYVFWGDNTSSCTNRGNSLTYDDNQHGAGSLTDPVNAIATDAADTADYFIGSAPPWNADWLYNTTNVYAVRIEVTRDLTIDTNAPAGYFYTIKTWIKPCISVNISDPTACSEVAGFSNTKTAYDPVANPPTLNRIIKLDQTFHSKFNKFLFGWTAAAGSASRENLALSNFQLFFVK